MQLVTTIYDQLNLILCMFQWRKIYVQNICCASQNAIYILVIYLISSIDILTGLHIINNFNIQWKISFATQTYIVICIQFAINK